MEYNNLEAVMKKYAKYVIQQAKSNLSKAKPYPKNKGNLYNTLDYKIDPDDQEALLVEFLMEDYAQFVDQGVKGTGSKGGRSKTTGQFTRGAGSPFKFKYDNPGGALVNAIRGWIKNKPISLGNMNEIGLAFAIGYSIKRRGLERTMFYSKPVEKALKTLPDELTEAFRLDFSKLIDKLPSKVLIETTK